MWWNDFKRLSFWKSLKVFFFFVVGAMLLYSLYWGFYRLLSYLVTVPYIGQLLIIKLVSMVFLWMFVMVIISSLIAGFSTIYFSSDLYLWMCSPKSTRSIFLWKAWETSMYSSWMIFIIFMPFLFAYGTVKGLGASLYLVIGILLIPFLVIATGIGIMIGTFLVSLCPHRRLRDGILVLVVLVGSGLYIMFRLLEPEELIRPDVFERVLQYVAVIQTPTAFYLPSWWITSAIQSYGMRNWEDFIAFSSILFFVSVITVFGMTLLGQWFFYRGWAASQESITKKKPVQKKLALSGRGSPFFSIIKKDIKIFFRDVNQWTQLLLLAALIVVYLFSIYKLPLDTRYLKSLISFLNIGMVGFVLAAISLRFVFPLISLEGRSYWILCSSPVSKIKLMWIKFTYAFPVIVSVGLIFIFISNKLLGASSFVQIISTGSIFLIALTLTGMGIGMGSTFPYFTIENIARIESSPGGILYMIFSLFYIGLITAVTAVPMRMYFFSQFHKGGSHHYSVFAAVWFGMLIISMVFFMVSFISGKKKLQAYEI